MRIMLLMFVTLVIASGCSPSAYGTGMRGGDSVPPRPPGATYPNWEHLCIGVNSQFGEVLDRAGSEGWEMVSATTTTDTIVVCFKRPAAVAPVGTPAEPAPGNSMPPEPAPALVVPEPAQ